MPFQTQPPLLLHKFQTKTKIHSYVSSALDSGLLKKAKDILNNHAFGTEAVKGVSQDYNKPLFIPAFSDSIQAIVGQSAGDSGRVSLDMWKHQYTTHFPQSVRIHYTDYGRPERKQPSLKIRTANASFGSMLAVRLLGIKLF